jgi:hypothetical protein
MVALNAVVARRRFDYSGKETRAPRMFLKKTCGCFVSLEARLNGRFISIPQELIGATRVVGSVGLPSVA